MSKTINLTLKIWRQNGPDEKGEFEVYDAKNIDRSASFLEMLDIVNQQLILEGKEPIAFDHDCREGICGSCGAMVDGKPHGPVSKTTICQLHMYHYNDGDSIVIEPFRAKGLPIVKDLVVDRSAFDRVITAGGYISVKTGAAPDGNAIAIPKEDADKAFNAATCIGCSACVAACPNASAMLFVSAKINQLKLLPQGQTEKKRRVLNMIQAMDDENFGNCSNAYKCEAECPKGISVENIAVANREYLAANLS